ncbi:TRAM domain-containing protein [Haladaptatus halobius]|uniref:TRAM domain-containing protein n=1 Tax=Haladaptatus halobius TaxID=2884875 RepID=UPI001D09F2B8|nr:TRAM domain-containing protein [Haladaptatus halobius]
MEVPDELLCLFSERIQDQEESYTITIPKEEITDGDIQANGTYHVALLGSGSSGADTSQTESNRSHDQPAPPVEEGERRSVEIKEIGEQGDGIARVERGYIIIVPETEQHERVTVEIVNVTPNVAFGEVVEEDVL